jgi:ribonuclease P protein component
MAVIIKSSQEIGSVLKEGSCIATPFFSLFYRTSPLSSEAGVRVAFIAGKKNGNAVWRNKAKRKLRAAWHLKTVTPTPCDFLLIAKRRTTAVSSLEIAQALDEAISREGLLQ